MKYSAWGRAGVADTFIPGDTLTAQLRQMDPGLELVKVFEATSWNDAMRQYHEWQGWEPYKPMLDSEGNEDPPEEPAPGRALE
jgi:hypothetical protein